MNKTIKKIIKREGLVLSRFIIIFIISVYCVFLHTGIEMTSYLAIAGNTLLVSTGRSIPAAFDKTDGRFLYYNPLEVYRHYTFSK